MTYSRRPAGVLETISLFLLCFPTFWSSITFSTLPVPAAELHALLELKARIDTSNGFLLAWNASNSDNICESWEGVTCTNYSGHHIGSIDLAGYGLAGDIPWDALSNCSKLYHLDLSKNQLTGRLSPELGGLSSIQYIYIGHNQLSGDIPWEALSNCSHLSLLDLSHNYQLTGRLSPEFGGLSLVQYIDISYNQLSGDIPWDALSNCSQLYHLGLKQNQLTALLSPELGGLSSVQYIDISYNQLSGDFPWDALSNCSQLNELDLSHNQLTGQLSPELGGLSSVQYIDISYNQLSGDIPWDALSNCSQLNELDLSHNQLTGQLSPELGGLSLVQYIDISNNQLSGDIPWDALSNCNQLSQLDLSHNQLTGRLISSNNQPTEAQPSLTLPSALRVLNVSFNNLWGVIPQLPEYLYNSVDASCFQGNPGLCGQIIQKPCMQPHQYHAHIGWKRLRILIAALATSVVLVIVTAVAICCFKYYHLSGRFSKVADRGIGSLAKIRHFSAKELLKSTQGYSETNLLGEGAMGVVYKGVLSNGELIAVKKFRNGVTCSREALLQEVRILSKLRHRNLVKVLGCVLNLEVSALVLEFMPIGSLEQYLSQAAQYDRLNWGMVLKVAQGVANALAYLHHEYETVPIIHGDVKPSNILLDSELEAHLADFGLAKLAKGNTGAISLTSNFKGSIGYMAPEFAYAAKITSKVDIYSFGVVVLEMVTGRAPTDKHLQGVSLPDWVKHKLASLQYAGGHAEIVQASLLQSSSSNTELVTSRSVQLLLQMALACTEELPSKRPTMQQIKAFLDSL